jgi:hypothetical protein
MTNKNPVRHIIILSAVIILSACLSACKKQEKIDIFPPVVFKPELGELTGGPINDNLIVTAVDKADGTPVQEAKVFVHDSETYELLAETSTGPDGTASFAGKGITGPVTVTLTCNQTIAYDTVSFIGTNSAKLTVPMNRRKAPDKVNTAVTFLGLDYADAKLSISRNEHTYPDIELEAGKLPEDPWTASVEKLPLAFSALSMDPGGNTTKFGFTIEPDGPLPVGTPAMVNMVPGSTDTGKICGGKIENPPANLDVPSIEWDPHKHYIFQIFGNGGRAGSVMTGFANIDKAYSYQAFIVQAPGLMNSRMEISAFNRSDAWGEMTTQYNSFMFENTPESFDVGFMNVPKQLQIEKQEGQVFPDLIWFPTDSNMTQLEIHHADYNYRWTLYKVGDSLDKITLPPLEPGSPGSLITGEIYRFRVIGWKIPGLDSANWSFQELREKATHRARSSLAQFMVALPK